MVQPFSCGRVPDDPVVLDSKAHPIKPLVVPPLTPTETVNWAPGNGLAFEVDMVIVALL
jgi:hypothetical protein